MSEILPYRLSNWRLLCSQLEEVSAPPLLIEKIALAQRGDLDAFEWIVREHKNFIAREAAKHVPAHSVEDVSQDTYIRLFRSLPGYVDRGDFRWWLKRLVTHASLDYWRSERRMQRLAAIQREISSTEAEEQRQLPLLLDLQRFLGELTSTNKVVFTLVFLEDRSQIDAAALVGCSLMSLKIRVFRLRRKLKQSFEV